MNVSLLNKVLRLLLIYGVVCVAGSCQNKEIENVSPPSPFKVLESYSFSQKIPVFQVRLMASLLNLPSHINQRFQHDIRIYRLIYRSKYQNNNIRGSGIVIIPDNFSNPPILSAQRGTIFASKEAPSRFFFSLNNFAGNPTGFEILASLGYIVVIADLFGFGASENVFHPYLLKEPSARASYDMLQATVEFLEAEKISFDKKLFLTGYSQGGYTTLALQELLEKEPIPLLSLTAVTAGAGPYNIEKTMEEIIKDTLYENPAFLIYVFHAYNQHYGTDYLRSIIFQPEVADKIPILFNRQNTLGTINAALSKRLDSVFVPNFLNDLRKKRQIAWLRVFRENHTDNFTPQTPLRLFHSLSDEVVPVAVSREAYRNFLNRDANAVVSFFPTNTSSHATGISPMLLHSILWFDSLKMYPK
ncbi:MAG: lipase family protein [Cytophagales bacterium]|nr:lipase family protein [Cytophagales bacterium]MDW8385046.1 lipase family protein [Flammeovirgaceae bacterium]